MQTLPSDIRLYDIALNLDLGELAHYCQTNRTAAELCNSDTFWHQKTLRDFGNVSNMNNASWRSIYIEEYKNRQDEACVETYRERGLGVRKMIDQIMDDDIILLPNDVTQAMGLQHMPLDRGMKTVNNYGGVTYIKGAIYTPRLFKMWWYRYIDNNGLHAKRNMVYPDQFMVKIFNIKNVKHAIKSIFTKSELALTAKEFNDTLDRTISKFVPDYEDTKPDNLMIIALCKEERRLKRNY